MNLTNDRGHTVGTLDQQFRLQRSSEEHGDIVATYVLNWKGSPDALVDKVRRFAVGQSVGTWLAVPGLDDDMVTAYQGRVISLFPVPSMDLLGEDGLSQVVIKVALPSATYGNDLSQILTACLGNDASTSLSIKLVELELPPQVTKGRGPNLGIEGIRAWLGVHDRPIVLNMIKPCAGITPAQGAAIFRETALGGVDLIKDDELLGSPSYSPIAERVRAYRAAAEQAASETGHLVRYIPNVTGEGSRLLANAEAAIDAGAEAVMVCYGTVGYGSLSDLARHVDVPILGHYAGASMFYEGTHSGLAAPLAMGALPRLAGADMAMLNTPYGGASLLHSSFIQSAAQLALAHPDLKPTMPIVGGGVHPGVVARYVADLGPDIMLAAGGAVQGHPDGARAGAAAMMQAAVAATAGTTLAEAAAQHPELAAALEAFGRGPS